MTKFHFELERELIRLQDELTNLTYQPGPYREFEIYEPKRRMISAAPYRDRVVHHALCGILEPLWEPSFIFDSYACRQRKGTHAAVDRFQSFTKQYRFVLKCDVRKYFPSIDHDILKQLIAHKIKDPNVLWLANRIIDNSNPQEPVLRWFAGDDLFAPGERRRGLPIGNQTSQFFSNVYLNPLDHFVKETLRCPAYARYCDDFVLLSNDKGWLNHVRQQCQEFLGTLRLQLHPHKSVISRAIDGTRFLGYRVFPDHRLLARENLIRTRRRLRKMQTDFASGGLSCDRLTQRIRSWIGHACHADTFGLRTALFTDITFSRPEQS